MFIFENKHGYFCKNNEKYKTNRFLSATKELLFIKKT